MNSVDLAIYKIQKAVDGVEVYETNTGTTSPLAARDLQKKLIGDKSARKIIYTPPNDIKRSILLPQRHFEVIARLADSNWHAIESLKSIRSETRKPVADARALGLIIETDRKKNAYRLRGEVELYLIGLGFGCLFIEWVYSEVVLTKRLNTVKAKQMKTSKSFYRDVMTGLFFMTGVLSFMSGQFILSTLLFGTASLASNLNLAMPARI